MRYVTVVAVALAMAMPGVPRQVASLDPALEADAIISVATGESARVADFARRAGAHDVQALGTLDLVTAHLDATVTRALAANVAVRSIDADIAITSSGVSAKDEHLSRGHSGASLAASTFRQLAGGNAPAVTVAVVDSGVADNADLAGRVVARVDFVNDGVTSYDPGGHGTFIAGLIAGSVTGVDPTAKIVSLRILN